MKTANNKIPVSSVFNDSERLYGKTVCRCLVRRPHYSARLMRFGFTWSERVRHQKALIAWEDAVQGLGLATSTVASNREMLFIGNVFYKQ